MRNYGVVLELSKFKKESSTVVLRLSEFDRDASRGWISGPLFMPTGKPNTLLQAKFHFPIRERSSSYYFNKRTGTSFGRVPPPQHFQIGFDCLYTHDIIDLYCEARINKTDEESTTDNMAWEKVRTGCVSEKLVFTVPIETLRDEYTFRGDLEILCRFRWTYSDAPLTPQSMSPGSARIVHSPYALTSDDLLIERTDEIAKTFNNPVCADFVIKVGKAEFRVAKSLLYAQSGFFREIFDNDHTDEPTEMMVIDEFDQETLELVLQFLHFQDLGDISECAVSLYWASYEFQIYTLRKYCEKFFQDNMNVDYVRDLLELGYKSETAVKDFALDFAVEHQDALRHIDGWTEWLKDHSEIGVDILLKYQSLHS